MDTIVLEAKVRDKNLKLNHLRADSRVSAEYYGKGVENMSLDLDYQDFRRAFMAGGGNTVFDLTIDGKAHKVLVHEVQMDPMTDLYTHIDFISVDMNKEVTTQIPLVFTGTAPAVKELGGTLIENRNEVTVKCLARDLIHEIEVDITSLEDFNAVIHISDITVPAGIEIVDELELTIATISAPKTAEQIEAEEAEATEAAAEVLEAVKDDDAEGDGDEAEEKKEKE
ncbi:50S ribosomal protein L25 [Candidatus Peregrinibacteria bacterium]|jgi:large subunit ribosomal protein L25|nr:50S ribosomal protein L25 [Candidatus Peregrinibacteria bacterium]